MRKIPTILERDWSGNRALVTDVCNPDALWVFKGEGVATIKWDGTSVLIRDGKAFKRYEVKAGKTAPPGFEPAGPVDSETGKQAGWVPVDPTDPADQWHVEGLRHQVVATAFRDVEMVAPLIPDGTYELVGPKVQGNPHNLTRHELWRHGATWANLPEPVTYDTLKAWLTAHHEEGIVWRHPDGRMAKIKARDFGIDWP